MSTTHSIEQEIKDIERKKEQRVKRLESDTKQALRDWLDSEGPAPDDIPGADGTRKAPYAAENKQELDRRIMQESREELEKAMRPRD